MVALNQNDRVVSALILPKNDSKSVHFSVCFKITYLSGLLRIPLYTVGAGTDWGWTARPIDLPGFGPIMLYPLSIHSSIS
jgi:hypothetical protein